MAVSSYSPPSPGLGDLIFTSDRKQRARIVNSLLGALIYLISSVLTLSEAAFGLVDIHKALALSVGMWLTALVFYVLLRTRISERFRDTSLTVQQILAGVTWAGMSYAISDSQRQISLLVMQVLIIFGIFNLRSGQVRLVWVYAVCLMAAIMGVMSQVNPVQYPPKVELIHFVLASTLTFVVSSLADQMGRMKAKLKSQKQDLETALERIQELATRDELTSVYNRRHMMELLDMQLKRTRRTGHRFSIGIIDMDFFKRINDTFGHTVGDEVLRGFAQQAIAVLRETDVLARWGGEEFLLLLPETRVELAELTLRRVSDHLAGHGVSNAVPELRASFSAGLTEYRDGESIGDAIERAERALSQAKENGRNGVVTA